MVDPATRIAPAKHGRSGPRRLFVAALCARGRAIFDWFTRGRMWPLLHATGTEGTRASRKPIAEFRRSNAAGVCATRHGVLIASMVLRIPGRVSGGVPEAAGPHVR